jgi:hypothetical protein
MLNEDIGGFHNALMRCIQSSWVTFAVRGTTDIFWVTGARVCFEAWEMMF